MEIQIGIDTLCFYHCLSPKQKSKIVAAIKQLPNFKTIESDYVRDSYQYASDHLISNGVKIHIFRKGGSGWGLFIIVHPTLVLGNDDRSALYYATKSSYNRMIKLVDKMLKPIHISCSLADMKLYRVDITGNVIFDNAAWVSEYIRILKKSIILPHYRVDYFRGKEGKAKDCKLANHHSHKQYCKSTAFFVYDKTAQLEMINCFPDALIGKKVLRLEAQLRRSAIKKWIPGKALGANWEIAHDIYKNGPKIINWYLKRLQPSGNIVRYENAVELVNGAKLKKKTKDRMLCLLRKTSDKDSLTTALEALTDKFGLNKNQCKTVLKKFSKLGISPITLKNSSELDELPSICL